MKIVVDTNVIFSGIFFEGLPGKLLEEILNGVYQIILSEEIVSEYRNVIVRYGKKKKVLDLSPTFIDKSQTLHITETFYRPLIAVQ